MKIANLTIKQMGAICVKHNGGIFKCNEKCPFFFSVEMCFLARRCMDAIGDKFAEREIDQDFIKTEIDEDFYMNRFMEVS